MIKIYRTDDNFIHEEDSIQEGVWIQMIHPTREEAMKVAGELEIDIDDVMAALDDEESSRIELEPGYTLILVDIPTVEVRHDKRANSFRYYSASKYDYHCMHGRYADFTSVC